MELIRGWNSAVKHFKSPRCLNQRWASKVHSSNAFDNSRPAKVAKRTASGAEVTIKCLMSLSKQGAKLATLILLSLVLLYYGVSNVHCSTVRGNRQDSISLLEFKRGIIDDPRGVLSNWNPDTHFCHWNGVNCTTERPWRVRKLILYSQGLTGQISSSLGNLTFLNTLDLSNNSFHGPIPMLSKLQHLENLDLGINSLQGVIPDALTSCFNLIHIDLSQNNLMGVIPPNIGLITKLVTILLYENNLTGVIPPSFVNIATLKIVDLSENQLTGNIPNKIWQMPNIQQLFLFKNNLTGVIPPSFGNIATLKIVDLSENQLTGNIPNKIWQMPNIQQLSLFKNNLSGGIPQNLSNLPSLETLSLAVNMLGGTLPSNIGDALPSLKYLTLGSNMFEGPIPTSLGNSSHLELIDLSYNNFSGQIPVSFGKLSNLSKLILGTNKLEAREGEGWEFFDALANCSTLSILSLPNNNLHGTIPTSIANLSASLTYLELGENQLSGIVPPSIQKFSGLIKLSLDINNLTGTIGDWIGKLTSMQSLLLQSNNFTGTIPPSISHLTKLTSLSLANNRFTGFIPAGLGNLKSMSKLNLSNNNFQGNIPMEFGSLRVLTTLDLSSNNFSGQIPETFDKFEQIQIIRLDENIIEGQVPNTFSRLMALSILNLSHNNLSGPIPKFLSNLTLLTKLDLSYNHFQGEIPPDGLFGNASIVSLDENPGLCGGSMDFHMPSCHIAPGRAGKVNYLVKILIPIFGFMSLVLLAYFLLIVKRTSRRAYMLEPPFGEHFEKVTYNALAQATRDFSGSNLIGRGSYGSVYRGRLKENKMDVAVKVFDLEMRGAERSFIAECEALRSIQHRNLLPIITACSTVDNAGNVFKALVYELMPNGSLDAWLHKGDEEAPKRLGLTQRISIALNIADALDYLHHDCGRPTVHCDLKPSNILLDHDMNALLGDFGIARLYVDPQSTLAGTISSIGVKGTIGYIPPEYGGGSHVSTSGDVYSFGIVLLEILTSKRPTDPMFKDGLDIISFVENNFPDQIYNVIDAHLVEECKNLTQEENAPENRIYQCLVDLLQVALACTRSLTHERLNMKQVASKMHAIKTSHFVWNNKR